MCIWERLCEGASNLTPHLLSSNTTEQQTRTPDGPWPETQGPENSGARRMGTSQSLLLTGNSYGAAAVLCCGKAQTGERKIVLGTASREDLQHRCFPGEGTVISARAFGYPQPTLLLWAAAYLAQKAQELMDKNKLLQDISCKMSLPLEV